MLDNQVWFAVRRNTRELLFDFTALRDANWFEVRRASEGAAQEHGISTTELEFVQPLEFQ